MNSIKSRVDRLERRVARVEHVVIKEQSSEDKDSPHFRIGQIKSLVCEQFHVTITEMDSPARAYRIVKARQAAMYLSRKHCPEVSLKEIGTSFHRSDFSRNAHSLVHHAVAAAAERMEVDKNFATMIGDISKRIGGAK